MKKVVEKKKNGNLKTQTDAKAQVVNFTYDALNRLENKTDNADLDVDYTYDDAAKKRILERKQKTPMKRYGTESEISAMVVFLLSPAAGFISGETMRVDGAVPNMVVSYEVPDHNRSKIYDGFHRSWTPDFLK